MQVYFFIIILSITYSQIFGQIFDTSISYSKIVEDSVINYVRNPSFEEFSECPSNVNQLHKCLHWQKVPGLNDSPDYFHRCSNYGGLHVGIPNNAYGIQEPFSGNAYSGIIMFEKGFYKEYLQNQLNKPLSCETVYVVGMYIVLANKSKFAIDRVRFCFTIEPNIKKKTRLYNGRIDDYLICDSGILVKSSNLGTDTINWIRVEGEYIASGGEKYLTIGVFDGDIKWWERMKFRRKIFNKNWNNYNIKVPYAYYYVDDVYVIRKEDYLRIKQND